MNKIQIIIEAFIKKILGKIQEKYGIYILNKNMYINGINKQQKAQLLQNKATYTWINF